MTAFADPTSCQEPPGTNTRVPRHAMAQGTQAILQAILDLEDNGIIIADEKEQIIRFGAGAERLFGYTEAEIAGCKVRVLLQSTDRNEPVESTGFALLTGARGAAGARWETRGRRQDGSTFPVALTLRPIAGGRLGWFVLVVHDLSAQRLLERELLQGSERERQRIGQEFHDGLGQKLSSIALRAGILEQKLVRNQRGAAAEATRLAGMVEEAVEQARRIVRGLYPVRLEQLGLERALTELTRQAEEASGVVCTYDHAAGPSADRLDATSALHLYRIVQEALHNAIRHGKARHVAVRLEEKGGGLLLSIRDDGTGIPNPLPTEGMGLSSMERRAHLLGGSLAVGRIEVGGTLVSCSVPRPPGR